MLQQELAIKTPGRSSLNITAKVDALVSTSRIQSGLCHLFIQHTSASLMLCENADPAVRSDLERFFSRLVPDGDRMFMHQDEGPDDMPAHIRSILTGMDITIPVRHGRLALGIWQGIYLLEHRHHGHRRQLLVTINGDAQGE